MDVQVVLVCLYLFLFFSSRRRHTRCSRDWSSDVCSSDLMDAAWEMGINWFDTANAYGGGRSETYIGDWLKAKGSRVRNQLILSSKVFNPVGDGPNDWGLSRRH